MHLFYNMYCQDPAQDAVIAGAINLLAHSYPPDSDNSPFPHSIGDFPLPELLANR